ncbi:MAG: putative transcriptional regulator [Methylobacteriaceae bacterium]|nr:putative transcriptional regulator [Methylobacteriaceae bacterium]
MGRDTRVTLEELRQGKPQVDYAKLDATTEEDIRRFQIEEGYDPDAPIGPVQTVYPPVVIREKLGLSQEEFARALRIPLETVQDWELGRDLPSPAARSLLQIVAKNPEAALKALAS